MNSAEPEIHSRQWLQGLTSAERGQHFLESLRAGVDTKDIAAVYGLSESGVYNAMAGAREDERDRKARAGRRG